MNFPRKIFIGVLFAVFLLFGFYPVWGEQQAQLFIKYDKPLLSANVQGISVAKLLKELEKQKEK